MSKSPVILNARKSFFDADAVIRQLDKGKREAFGKIGRDIRYEARGSMKRRKGASEPGDPPHRHKGQLWRLLFYSFDPAIKSVVVGPIKIGRGEAPSALEYGGRVTVRRRRRGKARAEIDARPFMLPALERSKSKIPDAYKGIM